MEATAGFRVQGLGGNEGMEKNMETNYSNGLYRDYYKDPFLHS